MNENAQASMKLPRLCKKVVLIVCLQDEVSLGLLELSKDIRVNLLAIQIDVLYGQILLRSKVDTFLTWPG